MSTNNEPADATSAAAADTPIVMQACDRLVLEDSWMYQLTVLSDLMGRRVSRALQSFDGINLSHWRVLAALADRPGRSASEVVKVTPMDKGLVSRAVSHLVEQGLIARQTEADDRRVSRLTLTARGKQLYAEILAAVREADADGAHSLPPDVREALHAALTQAIGLYRGDS